MAFLERKIGAWINPVSSEADRPARTAEEMKAVFDSNSNQLKDAVNGLIDDLHSPAAAGQIGSAAIERIGGSTVFEQLLSLRDYAESMGIDNGALVSVNGHIGKNITLTAADLNAAKAPVSFAVVLAAEGWAGSGPYTQSAAAIGVAADSIVDVSPAAESFLQYCECAVRAIGQEADALLFAAEAVPGSDLFANVRITD